MAEPTFGELLRRLRQQRGLSLAQLAKLTNYDPGYLSRVETGRRPPTATLARACETALATSGLLIQLVPAGRPRPAARHERPQPVWTGWLRPESDGQEWAIAICGSRAAGTNSAFIDQCVPVLGRLLTRLRCQVSHGPVGIGVEIMTWIADHYRPPDLHCLPAAIGRLNVIAPASIVLVIGGGHGTGDEVALALSLGKTVIPLATSGGAATDTHRTISAHADRGHLDADELTDLGIITEAEHAAALVERILRRKADTTP